MFLFQLWQTLLFGWSSQVDAQAAYAKFWVGSGLLYAGSAAFKSATTYCTSRCLTLSVFVLSSTATWSRTSSQLMLQKLVRGKKQTRERALQWRRWDTGWIRTDWIKWATDFNRSHYTLVIIIRISDLQVSFSVTICSMLTKYYKSCQIRPSSHHVVTSIRPTGSAMPLRCAA